jgi:hypothetical protein
MWARSKAKETPAAANSDQNTHTMVMPTDGTVSYLRAAGLFTEGSIDGMQQPAAVAHSSWPFDLIRECSHGGLNASST